MTEAKTVQLKHIIYVKNDLSKVSLYELYIAEEGRKKMLYFCERQLDGILKYVKFAYDTGSYIPKARFINDTVHTKDPKEEFKNALTPELRSLFLMTNPTKEAVTELFPSDHSVSFLVLDI